jgi:hypothetical protein
VPRITAAMVVGEAVGQTQAGLSWNLLNLVTIKRVAR